MFYSREICFEGTPPSIPSVVERVRQLTGIHATYVAQKWLLVNPADSQDVFCLYQEGDCSLLLLKDGRETTLFRATLRTLLEFGGHYLE